MTRTDELALIAENLLRCAASLTSAAEEITAIHKKNEPEPPSTPNPTPTLEQVRAVLADKSRRGYTAEIKALLRQHGADKLSEIAPSEYEALLAEVEAFGND